MEKNIKKYPLPTQQQLTCLLLQQSAELKILRYFIQDLLDNQKIISKEDFQKQFIKSYQSNFQSILGKIIENIDKINTEISLEFENQ